MFNDLIKITPKPTKGAGNLTSEDLSKPPDLILKPPIVEQRALEPGETGRQLDSQGLPVFESSKGIKAQELFKEDIADTGARFRRLEKAVMELRRDLDASLPAIQRLVAIESDIKGLILELEKVFEEKQNSQQTAQGQNALPAQEPATQQPKALLSQPVMAGDPALSKAGPKKQAPKSKARVPKVAQASQPSKTVPAKAVPGKANVTNIRFGNYPDKSRLVLDLTAATKYRVDIDPLEKLLVLELETAAWIAPKTAVYSKNPILKSYEVQENGAGVLVVFELRHEARIVKDLMLDALKGTGKRLFFDLISEEIHQ